jgi:gluconolactonase
MIPMHTYSTTIELDVRDDQLHGLIAADATLERIAGGFQFTEGPAWNAALGCLIFSDIIGNTMYCWSRQAGLSVFRKPSNMANGNALDHQDRMVTCEHATSRITRTEPDGTIEVLASHYNGSELNSPNDLAVHSSGAIYFSDPMSGRSARYGVERSSQLGFQGVYRLDPIDRSLTLLVDDFVLPNGLCFGLDERQLWINDTRRAHIRVFDIGSDGALSAGRVWAEVTGEGEGAPDGMKIDERGNVWCTGPGGIHIFAPDARPLGVVRIPERAANFAWGEDDRRTLYITASTSVYAIRTRVAGHGAV